MGEVLSMHEKKKILVIDDQDCDDIYDGLSTYMRIIHRSADFSIELLSDPEESIGKIRAFEPNLVLLDYKMTPITGLDVMNEISLLSPRIRPLVIFLTNYNDSSYRKAALDAGAEDYFVKFDVWKNIKWFFDRIENILLLSDKSFRSDNKPVPKYFEKRASEEIESVTDYIVSDFSGVEKIEILCTQWFIVEGDTMRPISFDEKESASENFPIESDIINCIEDYDKPMVWIDDARNRPSIWPLIKNNKAAEEILLLPVNVSSRGSGLWLLFVLNSKLGNSQKNDLEGILPSISYKWSEIVMSFARLLDEKNNVKSQLAWCQDELELIYNEIEFARGNALKERMLAVTKRLSRLSE